VTTLYYALGGGLGHLTRAGRVLDALAEGEDAVLLTASPFGHDPRVTGGRPVINVPPHLDRDRGAAFARWLAPVLREFDALLVDAFPGGILGELCELRLPPARHVARRLRWPAYARRLRGAPLPRYEVAYVLEPLAPDHAHALDGCAREVRPLALPRTSRLGDPLAEGPHVLVVHSGPEAEVARLVAEAADGLPVVVVHPAHRDVYPVAPHLAHAERIVTGGGFNLMHECVPYAGRHVAIPFPRPLDDQHARVRARYSQA
jgi:hypothetical protein